MIRSRNDYVIGIVYSKDDRVRLRYRQGADYFTWKLFLLVFLSQWSRKRGIFEKNMYLSKYSNRPFLSDKKCWNLFGRWRVTRITECNQSKVRLGNCRDVIYSHAYILIHLCKFITTSSLIYNLYSEEEKRVHLRLQWVHFQSMHIRVTFSFSCFILFFLQFSFFLIFFCFSSISFIPSLYV